MKTKKYFLVFLLCVFGCSSSYYKFQDDISRLDEKQQFHVNKWNEYADDYLRDPEMPYDDPKKNQIFLKSYRNGIKIVMDHKRREWDPEIKIPIFKMSRRKMQTKEGNAEFNGYCAALNQVEKLNNRILKDQLKGKNK